MVPVTDHVFDADHDTMEPAQGKSCFDPAVQVTGFGKGFFGVDPYEGVEACLRIDFRQVLLDDGFAGQTALRQEMVEAGYGAMLIQTEEGLRKG
jgi:hypothetical protein